MSNPQLNDYEKGYSRGYEDGLDNYDREGVLEALRDQIFTTINNYCMDNYGKNIADVTANDELIYPHLKLMLEILDQC